MNETTTVNSLFVKAENKQGFLKAGIMGFPGGGKSFTASEIAIGLAKMLKDKRPVLALDTEKGLDYLVHKFEAAKVELRIARTRAFVDLLNAIDEAEKQASVLIIDSITHFWEEVQESYKKANQRTRLTLGDWGPIKATWKQYTNKYLNSRVHIVMCGRAGDVFEHFEDEDGRKQITKVGTKMQAEKNLGYEPGLAIEMERVMLGDLRMGKRNFTNRAHIIKDRFDVIDGQYFDAPTFENFLPHVQKLNLGNHEGLSESTSKELFDKNSDKNWQERQKQTEIVLEEIQGEITSAIPGQSAEDKRLKADILWTTFGTRSWTAIGDRKLADLKNGLVTIKAWAEKLKENGKGE